MTEALTLSLHQEGATSILRMTGRVDSASSGQFEQQMETVFADGPGIIIVDMAGIDYMSSAGLRVLLMAAKRVKAEGRQLILCNMAENIREVFDISGFSAIFDIAGTLDEARVRAGA